MMTEEQKKIAEELHPLALRMAGRYRTDTEEAEGVALASLCDAVHTYDPSKGTTMPQYASICIWRTLRKWYNKRRMEQERGLAGGAPSIQEVESYSTNGRHVRKTEEETRGGRKRDLEEALVAPPDAPEWMADVISKLPTRLRHAAKLRWYGRYTKTMLADALGIPSTNAYRLIQELESFARLFLSGGGV